MPREIGKPPLRGVLFNYLLIFIILSFASNLSAQEKEQIPANKVNVVTLQSVITEADIVASYYPQKYPVIRWENLNIKDHIYQSPYKVSLFSSENSKDSARLWSQTQSIFAYGFGVIGIISSLSEDVSSWDKEAGIYNKWFENVYALAKEAGILVELPKKY